VNSLINEVHHSLSASRCTTRCRWLKWSLDFFDQMKSTHQGAMPPMEYSLCRLYRKNETGAPRLLINARKD